MTTGLDRLAEMAKRVWTEGAVSSDDFGFALDVGADTLTFFSPGEGSGLVYCRAKIASLDPEKCPPKFAESLLQGNFFWSGTRGSTISFSEQEHELYLTDRFDEGAVSASYERDRFALIKSSVAYGAERNAVAYILLFVRKTEVPVSGAGGNYDRFCVVLFAHIGFYGLIRAVIGNRNSFAEVKFRPLRHSLIHKPVCKIRARNRLKARNIFNKRRQRDLSSRSFFFKHENCFGRSERINGGSQTCRTAADDNDIVHNRFHLL